MDTKEIKINCPEGFEVDKENSTFECIKFKPIKNKIPKTWEEFCMNNDIKEGEFFIDQFSHVKEVYIEHFTDRDEEVDKNILPSKELAEAMLALCQLIQLRDCYNDGWTPDWTNKNEHKHIILRCGNVLLEDLGWSISRVLAFKTEELRDQFLENFRDLIETAKPLL